MFLLQRIRNAIVPSRIVGSKLVTRTFGAIAVLTLAQVVAAPLRAQDQDSKKLLGQRLVDEVAAKHKPDMIYLGLHSQTPKSKKSVIFASTDSGKIGKKSSCADLHVVEKGTPVMEMKGKSTTVLERLLDSSGHTVGLIVVGFNYSDGQEAEAAKLAKQVGEELAQQIPSKNKLFETGK
jgi:RNase H-fold protein (predicted Holliday junction resolvase)